MTNLECQYGRHGSPVLVANYETDMTLFFLILNLVLTLKLTLETNSNS